ncbi:hypothetical protein H4I95_08602 [Botrytis cinerea]
MKWFHIPEEKRQGPARSYYRGLCTVTTASIIVILFILISLVCQFPGKNNSILDIETPSITYKIYIYQYCVSSGHENDSGVDQNPNARDGLGCHLDLNPLGYIVATTNMQAEPSDLAAFYALMTAAFAFYYIGLIIFCIPASCLTHASYLSSGISTPGAPKSYSKIGNLYILFVHSLWLWYLASLLVIFLLRRKEYPPPPRAKQEKEEDTESVSGTSMPGSYFPGSESAGSTLRPVQFGEEANGWRQY